ncbi:hypothetical protein BDE02_11G075700 [Populus trichocarpa]|nr:hypothetical protein BDE02_11G075700 [Populus trichocarpa]
MVVLQHTINVLLLYVHGFLLYNGAFMNCNYCSHFLAFKEIFLVQICHWIMRFIVFLEHKKI